jgi:hypothetical protein
VARRFCHEITALQRKASPGPVPRGDYRQAPFAAYSAAVGSAAVCADIQHFRVRNFDRLNIVELFLPASQGW